MKQLRVNERIRISQVRVIGEDGSQLGVMPPLDALKIAREHGLDLVEVAPLVSPPVCRIMDFNKFRYEEQRRDREAKKKHHVAKLKEVKFKPHIEDHDYKVKFNMLHRFLMRGDQAKVTMVYRGRELAHTELGRKILDRLIDDLKPISKVERMPNLEGRFMTMIFGPDRDKIKQLEREQARQQKLAAKAGSRAASPAHDAPSAPADQPAAPGKSAGATPAGELTGKDTNA